MNSTNNLLAIPEPTLSKIVSIEPYVALVNIWFMYKIRSEGVIQQLCNSTAGGGYYFDDRHLPAFHPSDKPYHLKHKPEYPAKLTAHLPTHETFALLRRREYEFTGPYREEEIQFAKSCGYKILPTVRPTRNDFALDFTCHTREDAIEVLRYFISHLTTRFRRNQEVTNAKGKARDKSRLKSAAENQSKYEFEAEDDVIIRIYESEPPYEDYEFEDDNPPDDDDGNVRYTGKATAPNIIAAYVKDKCPINGLPAAHIEWRVNSYQALNRIKIFSASDIETFNIEEFLYPRFLLKDVDDSTLERIGKIITGETSTRYSHSDRIRNRQPESQFIDYLSSYRKLGNQFCRGSLQRFHGEFYTDVQDILDRLRGYGVRTRNIRKYFPDIDVSILNI